MLKLCCFLRNFLFLRSVQTGIRLAHIYESAVRWIMLSAAGLSALHVAYFILERAREGSKHGHTEKS